MAQNVLLLIKILSNKFMFSNDQYTYIRNRQEYHKMIYEQSLSVTFCKCNLTSCTCMLYAKKLSPIASRNYKQTGGGNITSFWHEISFFPALINCPQFVKVVTCDNRDIHTCQMRTDAPGTQVSPYTCAASLTVCCVLLLCSFCWGHFPIPP